MTYKKINIFINYFLSFEVKQSHLVFYNCNFQQVSQKSKLYYQVPYVTAEPVVALVEAGS